MASPTPKKYALTERDILYFLHIPKTAGTTVRHVFENRFRSDTICTDSYHFNQFVALPKERLQACKFLAGHIFYDAHKWLPQRPVFITFLRHPVDRFLSYYYFIRKFPDHRNYAPATKLSAVEFAELTANDCSVNNTSSYLLGMDIDREATMALAQRDPLLIELNVPVDEAMAQRALERLPSFAFVGLAERFRESLALLSYDLGFPLPDTVASHNVNRERTKRQIDPAEFEAIAEINRYDMQLYDLGVRLFEQRYQAMMTDLLEAEYQEYAPSLHTPSASLNLTLNKGINGVGWHEPESSKHGTPYRWTGPGTEATLDVTLDSESDLEIEVTVLRAISPDILQSVSLSVNDVPLTMYQDTTSVSEGYVYRGIIPRDVISPPNRFTRLSIHVSQTQQPANISPDDDRYLGIAVHAVRLSPVNIVAPVGS